MENSHLDKLEILEQLRSPDPDLRRQAIEIFFNQEPDDEVLTVLCSLLSDENPGVRDAANNVLLLNDKESIPVFLVPLISSSNIAIRNLAGELLIRKGEKSINSLISHLSSTDNVDDQKFIIDVLGLIGVSGPEKEIIEVFLSSSNDNVKLACIEALGNLKSVESSDILMKYYDKADIFKPTIIEALGKLESPAVLDFILDKYTNEDELTKFAMLECIGKLGNDDSFFFLLSELKYYEPPLSWEAIRSLKLLKDKLELDIPFDESTKNSILNALKEGDVEYKKPAVSLLKSFIDKEVFRAYLNIYGKDCLIDEEIKNNVYPHFEMFVKQVIEYLDDSSKNLRAVIDLTREMFEMKDPSETNGSLSIEKHKLCEKLTGHLTNPDEEVRRIVMELLFHLSHDTAIIFADTMSSDQNVWNRLRLVELLEVYRSEKTLPVLEMLARDEDEMIKDRVLQVLSGINN
jgi:HEAT repeat protein